MNQADAATAGGFARGAATGAPGHASGADAGALQSEYQQLCAVLAVKLMRRLLGLSRTQLGVQLARCGVVM